MLLAERLRSEEEKTAMRIVLEEQVSAFPPRIADCMMIIILNLSASLRNLAFSGFSLYNRAIFNCNMKLLETFESYPV